MKIIKALISGWYAGKGFKSIREEKYEKSLINYERALDHSWNKYDPVIYDSMAIALYKLNRHDEALIIIRKSLEQYSLYKGDYQKVAERVEELKKLEEYLQNNK